MKKALIVVDYQNDFIDGALGFEGARAVEAEILRLCESYEGDLIFTFDTHGQDYLQTREGQNLPIKHCIKGSFGWQMPEIFAPHLQRATRIFEKGSFGSLELANFLREKGYEELAFCGLVSHICVFSNIILAYNALPNASICLYEKATASFDKSLHEAALQILRAYWVKIL